MYQKEEVERLAGEYVETGDEQVFEALIKALRPLIDVQLGKNYSSLKLFWDDLRQDVLEHLYKVRGNIQNTTLTSKYLYLYGVIREILHRFIEGKKYKNRYKLEAEKIDEALRLQPEETVIKHGDILIIKFNKDGSEKSKKIVKSKSVKIEKGDIDYLPESLELIEKRKRANFRRQLVGMDE